MTSRQVQTGLTIAAGIVGLAAYVYLLGGAVIWLRLTAARLPSDVVSGNLEKGRLAATGLKVVVFEVILLLAVYGVTRITVGSRRTIAEARGSEPATDTRGEETEAADGEQRPIGAQLGVTWALIQALLAAIVGYAVGTLVESLVSDQHRWRPILAGMAFVAWIVLVAWGPGPINGWRVKLLEWFPNWLIPPEEATAGRTWRRGVLAFVAGGLAIVFLAAPLGVTTLVFLGLLALRPLLDKLLSGRHWHQPLLGLVIVGLLLNLPLIAYLATPPVSFDRAVVETNDGQVLTGGYIGRSSDGLLLATCKPTLGNAYTSHATHLRVIPSDRIKNLTLGGYRYTFDYGKRPSLYDLGRFTVQRDRISDALQAVPLDPRGHKLVCGQEERREKWSFAPVPSPAGSAHRQLPKSTDTRLHISVTAPGVCEHPQVIDPGLGKTEKQITISPTVRTIPGDAFAQIGCASLSSSLTYAVKLHQAEGGRPICDGVSDKQRWPLAADVECNPSSG